jgi:hypothetical protein
MVGFTANKIETALHKHSTQLMMSETVADLCTTKYSSLLGCGAEQFPLFSKMLQPFEAMETTYPVMKYSTNNNYKQTSSL